VGFREVNEGAGRNHQRLELFKDAPPGSRHEAVSRARDVDQVLASVLANDDGVQPVRPWRVATDHKLLAEVESMLNPSAAAFAGFVLAI